MNLVDSSGWLEFFADGPNADFFAEPIGASESLLVSTINLYEVFKKLLQEKGELVALQAVTLMQSGKVLPVDAALAITAAKLSAELQLPMADSIILQTARQFGALLFTQDADFSEIEGVRYISKK